MNEIIASVCSYTYMYTPTQYSDSVCSVTIPVLMKQEWPRSPFSLLWPITYTPFNLGIALQCKTIKSCVMSSGISS